MIISMSIDQDIKWFFLVILLIKESCYMIGLETKLTKPNHQPKVVVSAATFKWWLTPCKKKLDWTKGTPGNIQPKVLISGVTFPRWLSPCKKLRYQLTLSRNIDDQRIMQSDWTKGATKNGSLRCHLKLVITSMRKRYWFFPENLLIKESCNLNIRTLATPNQKW